jgi:hypothetical protein
LKELQGHGGGLIPASSMEERMSKEVNESGAAPAAMALTPGESPASYVLSTRRGISFSSSLSSSEPTFVRQRADANEADRPFLLWCLAGLIVATVTCGAIAMSAVVTIAPVMN